jgi:hypothetical protein
MHYFNLHVVLGTKRQPAALVVLQAIAGPFDLDHAIALLGGPELDQVGHAGAVGADVSEHAFTPEPQVAGRDALQSQFQQ